MCFLSATTAKLTWVNWPAGVPFGELSVGLASGGRWVRVTIRDDGLGLRELRANSSHRGRGLNNMNQRARAVGGRLEVLGEAVGCLVSLALPIAAGGLGSIVARIPELDRGARSFGAYSRPSPDQGMVEPGR